MLHLGRRVLSTPTHTQSVSATSIIYCLPHLTSAKFYDPAFSQRSSTNFMFHWHIQKHFSTKKPTILWTTCGTHTLCVSGGAQHSPAQMQRSWAKIFVNLYVLDMPDSSRCIVKAIFHSECTFSIFLMCHLKISNNLFWVISMFILAENCTEFIII